MTASGSGARFREVWSSPEARALLLAQFTSEMGDQIARVAVALLVLDRTDSLLLSALSLAVAYVPGIFGTAVLGTLADRVPRRALMLWCDLIRMLVVIVLALVVAFDLPLVLVFVLLLVSETVAAPFTIARSALWPDVMPQRDLFVAAHALSRSLFLAAQVAGFLLGGLLMDLLGVQSALLLDALTFLVSYLLIRSRVQQRPAVDGTTATSFGLALSDVGVGGRELLGDPLRRWLVMLAWASALFLIAPEAVALGWREPMSATVGGLLLAAVPAGAAIGFLLIARWPLPRQVDWVLPLAALSCLPLFATSINPPPAIAGALWFASGVLQAWVLTVMASVTALTAAQVRGRVVGVASAGFSAATAVSFVAVGALADRIGPALAVSVAGLLGLAAVGVAKLRDPGPALVAAVARADLLSPVAEEVVDLVDSRGVPVGPDGLPTQRVNLNPGSEAAEELVLAEAPSQSEEPSQPEQLSEPAEQVIVLADAAPASEPPVPDPRFTETVSLAIEPEPSPPAATAVEALTVLPGSQPPPSWPVTDPDATQPVPTH